MLRSSAQRSLRYSVNDIGSLEGPYGVRTYPVAYTYDYAGRSASPEISFETNNSGTLAGIGIHYEYDQYLRKTNVKVVSGNGLILSNSYAFDSAERLKTASDGSTSVGYSYLANSPLIGQISFTNGGSVRMTTTKNYDYLNRLLGISSVAFQTNVISSAYRYNDANQRTANHMQDGSYWIYQYDSLGQVTSGKRYWSDGTPVAGQQFEYAFDDIVNRTSAQMGGDASGGGLRSATYSANSLNQYTNRTNPSAVDILGAANAGATVSVNGQSTYRKGEYYQTALTVTNSTYSLAQIASNQAVLSGSTNLVSGAVFVPKVNESFSYDADGNLTSDAHFNYTWEAENRLASMTNNGTANEVITKLIMTYDSLGRRVRLLVQTNGSGGFISTRDVHYVYDGRNLIAELNATNNNVINTFLWGTDLSGSMEGAGGVGGLLLISNSPGGAQFFCYDGNGNVVALLSASAGTASAQYEYGPYGELNRASGSLASANAIRFSTKIRDNESSLLYYGSRLLSESTGRWQNRDPLAEAGGFNLFSLAGNDPVCHVDRGGLDLWPKTQTDPHDPRGRQRPNPPIKPPPLPPEPPLPPKIDPTTPAFNPTEGRLNVAVQCSNWMNDLANYSSYRDGLKICRSQSSKFNGDTCCVIVFCTQCGCVSGSVTVNLLSAYVLPQACPSAEKDYYTPGKTLNPRCKGNYETTPIFVSQY